MDGSVRVVKLVQRVEEMEVQTCGKPLDALIGRVLCTNILSSDYFKELFSLKTYTEVVDEIYNQVDHVEPCMDDRELPGSVNCILSTLQTCHHALGEFTDAVSLIITCRNQRVLE